MTVLRRTPLDASAAQVPPQRALDALSTEAGTSTRLLAAASVPEPLPSPPPPRPLFRGAFPFVPSRVSMLFFACLLSALWLCLSLMDIVFGGPDAPALSLTRFLIAVLPLALLWAAVYATRQMHELRSEAQRLRASLAEVQKNQPAARNSAPTSAANVRPAALSLRSHTAPPHTPRLAPLVRDLAPQTASAAGANALELEQPRLALEATEAPAVELTCADFIRALQFPESPEDEAGFHALRLALAERGTARLIRAAQDVLTLLSQDGIYMDDLAPERSHPDLWRRFAKGERGRAISAIGGVRDRSRLALSVTRMREDPVFRDAVHHFLRMFDKVFQDFETKASDADLIAFSDGRTARAFMLLGRASGVFD